MNGDLTELFDYLGKEFGEVRADIKELKENFDLLQKSVDSYAVKADKFFDELVMLSNKVDRHEKWIHQLADKLGIRLEY